MSSSSNQSTDEYKVCIPRPETFGSYPKDVGILAMESYFPSYYIDQTDLEKYDGVASGKYTIGLGQESLAFCSDREDIYSVSLTVVSSIMKKYNICYKDVGRLEVATETILDHSKSVKTFLMQLFESSGNTDVEGVDTINACYAGTNALFNSVAWVESSSWDGRYAIVVCADIAEYAKGPARPTGGCGAVAFVIGPNAPIPLERGLRASHMEHAYDFYKPNLSSPYPVVDGKFSQLCYLRALDTCYQRLCAKHLALNQTQFELNSCDFVVFHAPYNKLVMKSFGRLLYNDFRRFPDRPEFEALQEFRAVAIDDSYTDSKLEKAFVKASKAQYMEKVAPSTELPKRLGNLYTGSLYAGLMSLVSNQGAALAGKRVLMFSYGSGLAASMFSLKIPDSDAVRQGLTTIQSTTSISSRLSARKKISPEQFNKYMDVREELHVREGSFVPEHSIEDLFPGTFYLTEKDNKSRRTYKQARSNL